MGSKTKPRYKQAVVFDLEVPVPPLPDLLRHAADAIENGSETVIDDHGFTLGYVKVQELP